MPSSIPLFDPQAANAPRILQLAQDLELLGDGDPPANSLFVLGHVPDMTPGTASLWRDQLLIVDPPADVTTRFRLEGDVAVLFTGAAFDAGLPLIQTIAGGVAHIRIGEHFLDVYVQPAGTVVYLPATGVVLGGDLGSDVVPPRLAPGSDGSDELDALRLIARLLKTRHFQLFIPRRGTLVGDKTAVMQRLAVDVEYLHGLRRVVPGLVQRGEALETIERIPGSLLPNGRRSPAAAAVHEANLCALIENR
jgi:hypothetical protein